MAYRPYHGFANDFMDLDVGKEPSAEWGVQFMRYEEHYGQVARSMKGGHG